MARYQAALESKNRAEFKAAAETLDRVAAKYPQGKHAAAALYCQGESLIAEGDPRGAISASKQGPATFDAAGRSGRQRNR